MLRKILKFLKLIVLNGCDNDFNPSLNRIIVFTNALALVGFVVLPSVYSQLSTLGVDESLTFIYKVFFLTLFMIPLLNYLGRIRAALVFGLVFLIGCGWLAAVFFGKSFNGHYFFFVALIYSVVAFSQQALWFRCIVVFASFFNFLAIDYLTYFRIIPITGFDSSEFPIYVLLSDTIVVPTLIIVLVWIEKSMADRHEQELEKALVLVQNEKRKIQVILDNINMGIILTDSNLKISSQYSERVREMFPGEEPEGADLLNFVFQNGANEREDIVTVGNVLNVSLGEDELNWELNEDKLIKEDSRYVEGQEQVFRFSWTPIVIDSQVDQVILAVEDITEERTQEKRLAEEKRLQKFLGFVLKSISKVGLEETRSYLQAIEKFPILIQEQQGAGLKEAILQALHGFKGEARMRGLDELSELIHGLESEVLAGNKDLSVGSFEELVNYGKDLNSSLQKIYPQEGEEGSDWSLTEYLLGVLQSLLQSKKAAEVQLWASELRLTSNFDKIPSTIKKELQTSIVHVLQNAVDHGYILPNLERPVQLHIEAIKQDGKLKLSIQDEGAGLNIEKLNEIYQGLDVAVRNQIPRVEDVVFLQDMSTASQVTLSSGRGIGLSAVKEMVDNLGGTISISNRTQGSGTIAEINLPLPK